MEYFILDGTKTIGPFSKEELKQRSIMSSTLIYTDETNWVEAKTIPDLADIVRRVPPPPPNHTEVRQEEPQYQTTIYPQEPKKSNKGLLYGLLITLGLGGGGTFIYQQQQQTNRLQDEVRSRDMEKQEEVAKAEREKKKIEIENEKQRLRSQKASLETEYSVQQDKLGKVQEFKLLRTAAEREEQVRAVNSNLRSIEEALRICNKRLEDLENLNY